MPDPRQPEFPDGQPPWGQAAGPARDAAWAFDGLTPLTMLDALAGAGWDGDGRLLQLNSYENRVVRATLEDGSRVVAKFYRPGRWSDAQILEEHAFAAELAAAEVPVAAPLPLHPDRDDTIGGRLELLAATADAAPTLGRWVVDAGTAPPSAWRLAVARNEPGRAPELDDPDVLTRIGGYVARMHAVGARAPFQARRTLHAPEDAREALASLAAGDWIPPEQRAAWQNATDAALRVVDERWQRAGDAATTRLHGDLHAGNVLWSEHGSHVVDLDDACNGPAVQDLWMLLSGDAQQSRWQLACLLEGYEALREFDPRELALIPALRLTRMLRHNAWIALRHADPAFLQAWPDFGSSAYWGQQAMQLREVAQAALDIDGDAG